MYVRTSVVIEFGNAPTDTWLRLVVHSAAALTPSRSAAPRARATADETLCAGNVVAEREAPGECINGGGKVAATHRQHTLDPEVLLGSRRQAIEFFGAPVGLTEIALVECHACPFHRSNRLLCQMTMQRARSLCPSMSCHQCRWSTK